MTTTITSHYAITETKKAELDALTIEVQNAQEKVEQLQAVVDSLTEKKDTFNADFIASKDELAVALQNKNDLSDIINKAKNLMDNSTIAHEEVLQADLKTRQLAKQVRDVMLQLIYSAEIIDNLQNLITRKKALNPLISDDLVTMITTAGADANNAVSLMLVALNSTFTAQASIIEATAASGLEKDESHQLYNSLIPAEAGAENGPISYQDISNISNLINGAFDTAEKKTKDAGIALKDVENQLNIAESQLMQAQIKLQSLESGLAAANAAALAS